MTGTGFSLHGVTKRYAGTTALDDVSFEVGPGTFHALLGGNGSGKSTAIKVLAGVENAESGEVRLGDHRIDASHLSPRWSDEVGIRFVHQDLGLLEPLTVAENIAMTTGYGDRAGLVRWREVRRAAQVALDRIGLDVSPAALVAELRPAQRTLVAIARCLTGGAGAASLLVLDEPTASLPDEEATHLLERLQALTRSGTTVLYVTHRLDEVLRAADAVTVLRDGRHVETRPRDGLDHDTLVELIVGRAIESLYPDAHDTAEEPVLEVSGLRAGPARDVSFTVRRGEVVGIGGAVGSGRSSVLRALFGDLPAEAGSIVVGGEAFRPASPGDAIEAGLAYVPEDRGRDAGFATASVSLNLAAVSSRRSQWLSLRRERQEARRDVEEFGVRVASVLAPFRSMSGGNQQKTVLARWLRLDGRVLLLDEPTQGVDVGARADIYRVIRAAADEGLAVVVVSSDFEELAGLADRVVVMAAGRVVGEAPRGVATRDWIAQRALAPTEAAA